MKTKVSLSDIFPLSWCEEMMRKIEALGPKERPIKETILWVMSQSGNPSFLKKREREGIESGFDYYGDGRIGIIWPSFSKKIGTLKKRDHVWILIIDLKSPEPFFWIPIRRPRNRRHRNRFLKRVLEQVKVMVSLIDNWPTCGICGHELVIEKRKKYVETNDDGLPFHSEHMRWMVCPYRTDGKHEESSACRIVDAPSLTYRLKKVFSRPFDRNKSYVGRYFQKHNRYPNSARTLRAGAKFNFEVPKKNPDFNDLQYQNQPDFNDSPYPDSG